MALLATDLWLDVEWFRPDPELGKGSVFHRDIEMVKSADLVLAFFATTTMIGGTAHVVDRAMDLGTPVYAYGLTETRFERIGEHDADDAWGKSVPG